MIPRDITRSLVKYQRHVGDDLGSAIDMRQDVCEGKETCMQNRQGRKGNGPSGSVPTPNVLKSNYDGCGEWEGKGREETQMV